MSTLTSQTNINLNGKLYTSSVSATYGSVDSSGPITVPSGKAGTLTTRTSDTEGVITGSTGHGVTTGAKLDIQFTGGRRYNVTVGTVDGNSIPISGGAGDNLPADESALVFCVPTEINTTFSGTDCKGFAAQSSQEGCLTLQTDAAVAVEYDLDGENAESWIDGEGITNPITGDTISKLTISNFSTSASALFNFDALLDSVG